MQEWHFTIGQDHFLSHRALVNFSSWSVGEFVVLNDVVSIAEIVWWLIKNSELAIE
jgi:hypothetical protein